MSPNVGKKQAEKLGATHLYKSALDIPTLGRGIPLGNIKAEVKIVTTKTKVQQVGNRPLPHQKKVYATFRQT